MRYGDEFVEKHRIPRSVRELPLEQLAYSQELEGLRLSDTLPGNAYGSFFTVTISFILG